jgi:hypothetical protein
LILIKPPATANAGNGGLWHRRGQFTVSDIHLQAGQDQQRRRQRRIAGTAHGDEIVCRNAIMHVDVAGLLRGHTGFAGIVAAPGGQIIAANKDAGFRWQRRNLLDGSVQHRRVAAGEIAGRRAVIRHEQPIPHEGCVAPSSNSMSNWRPPVAKSSMAKRGANTRCTSPMRAPITKGAPVWSRKPVATSQMSGMGMDSSLIFTCQTGRRTNANSGRLLARVPGGSAFVLDSGRWEHDVGAPGRTRTCNPEGRSHVLYPVELRARGLQLQRKAGKIQRYSSARSR